MMLRPAPFARCRDFTGFKVPGTANYVFPGMIWGSAFSTPGVMNKGWEPSDFPMSDRPVLDYGKSCLFTLSYEGRRISYSNHWGSDPIWGVPAGPAFQCTDDYKSEHELNLKAYVRHNMQSERNTLLVVTEICPSASICGKSGWTLHSRT